jgi:cell wall-associated NlpC family hydrolase
MRGRGNSLIVAGAVASLAFGALAQPAQPANAHFALRHAPQAETRIGAAEPAGRTLAGFAVKYLGRSYQWGGRNTRQNPNLDCLGLIFLSIEDKTGIPWNHWSVYPKKLIKQLDKKNTRKTVLFTNDPLLDSASVSAIKEGEILFFLVDFPSPGNDSVAADGAGRPLYVGHTGICSGGGNAIHASPFNADSSGRKVVNEPVLGICRSEILGVIAVEPVLK